MNHTFNPNGSLADYQYLMDTIWTIYLEDGYVEVQKDSMNPELANTKHDYISLNNIIKNDVYPPDHCLWDETVSLEAFHKMIAEGCFHKTFDLRFCVSAMIISVLNGTNVLSISFSMKKVSRTGCLYPAAMLMIPENRRS